MPIRRQFWKRAWDTARDFLDSKRQADGTLSKEDSKTYDAMEATIVNLGKEIQRMERQAEIEAEMAKATSNPMLYTISYLYENRNNADYHKLTLTLRSLLFAQREGVI